jgi:hypothetical protein
MRDCESNRETSVDDIKAEIRTKQATMYPTFADQINAGVTMWDLTSSYRQKMSDLLEVDPDSIKWDDPKLNINWPLNNPILSERDLKSKYIQ